MRNAREAALCARAAGAIPLIRIGVHLAPLPRALAWLTPRHPSECPLPAERVRYLVGLVLDHNVLGIRPTCLLRSLVLYRFLRENGAGVRLHLGVRTRDGALTGHAWLTMDGAPVLERTDPAEQFTVVLSYPPALTAN